MHHYLTRHALTRRVLLLGLITLAALLPATWNLRLVDRNAVELCEADLAWADLVMTGSAD